MNLDLVWPLLVTTIVVGAWHDNSVNDNGATIENTGSAYVFARTGTTWAETEQIKLTAGDGVAGDELWSQCGHFSGHNCGGGSER